MKLVCVCVCVLVQWRESTRIRSNTNSLRAPGFFLFFQLTACVFPAVYRGALERSARGKPHKNPNFWPFPNFSNRCICIPPFQIRSRNTHLLVSSSLESFFFSIYSKRWSQYNSTTKPWAEITAVELSGTRVHLPARVDVAHTLSFLFFHRSAVESQKCRGARSSNHPPRPPGLPSPPVQLSITRLLR